MTITADDLAREVAATHNAHLDERDRTVLARYITAYDEDPKPRVGDYVRFVGGVERRISHIWDWKDGSPVLIQTSDGGSRHFAEYGVSFSGGLHPGVNADTLARSEGTKLGSVWIWHHGYATAHNGVDASIPFRIYVCAQAAT